MGLHYNAEYVALTQLQADAFVTWTRNWRAASKGSSRPRLLTRCASNMWGIVRWIGSTLGGEVSVADLDARRGAGTAAYSLLDEANAAAGDDRSTRLFRLCAWNAFALQTIADTLIAADAAADPRPRLRSLGRR